jgi:hypothetical protein
MSTINVAPQSGTTGPFFLLNADKAGVPLNLALDSVLFPAGSPPVSIANALFSLSVDPAKHTGLLSIQQNAWKFDGTDLRASVKTAFDDFMVQVDAKEGKGLLTGGTAIVRAAVAGVFPATFAESLYLNYGLLRQGGPDPQTYVDLLPGMRLRVESQVSQFVAPAGTKGGAPNPPLANGYVAGGQAIYDIVETVGPTGATQIGIDAFVAGATVPVVDQAQGGAGGIVDLQGPNRRGRYLRLVYPKTMPSSDSVGSSDVRQNAALLWADDLKTLAQKTQQYYAAAGSVAALFFRGRTLAVPELRCVLNGAPAYVPVGTTIRQLIQRVGTLARVPGVTAETQLKYTRVASIAGQSLFHANSTQVSFTRSTALGPDAYDAPVLAADTCTFTV